MTIRQVSPRRFPTGDSRYIAVLAPEPDTLAKRHGLVFERDTDGLGDYRCAMIELPSGALISLLRHVHESSPGTLVVADSGADRITSLGELLRELGLTEADVIWYPEAEARGWKPPPRAYWDAWGEAFGSGGAEPTSPCPICGAHDLHRRCSVDAPLDQPGALGHGEVWEWCGTCRHYSNFHNAIWASWTTGATDLPGDVPMPPSFRSVTGDGA